jgi:hypothetical protein
VKDTLEELVAAGRWPERAALGALLTLARRPRGASLLARVPALHQTAFSLLAMARYDEPATARRLGFDAQAVARRGLELRRAEGRP